jgi:hypothetical protein
MTDALRASDLAAVTVAHALRGEASRVALLTLRGIRYARLGTVDLTVFSPARLVSRLRIRFGGGTRSL